MSAGILGLPDRERRSFLRIGAAALLALGCAPTRPRTRVPVTAPEESTTFGPGDVFTLRLVGDEDKIWGAPLTVDSDGTAELPYVHRVKVAGLEPQELSQLMRKLLMDQGFFTDPSVIVRVEEYRSKQITILGQVQRPGSFPFRTGMTFVQGVSLAGGLNAIAKSHSVKLTRSMKGKGTFTYVLDFDAINSGTEVDPPLQAGDRIFVEERVF